jgi:hypothetical protein
MPKVATYIFTTIKILIVVCIILALLVFINYKYNQTYAIKYTYDGIKYQANNLNSGIPLSIEVDGVYKKGYFGNPDIFVGKIIVDGELCYAQYRYKSHEYGFNNYNMSQIESDKFEGHFFIGDMFKEITIEIHEPVSLGKARFSYLEGWLISAPAENRAQAVYISNRLIQKQHKDLIIK